MEAEKYAEMEIEIILLLQFIFTLRRGLDNRRPAHRRAGGSGFQVAKIASNWKRAMVLAVVIYRKCGEFLETAGIKITGDFERISKCQTYYTNSPA